MDRLPQEIILNICRELCTDDDYFPVNMIDLKSMRLCSRAFAGPAAELLFFDVFIVFNHRNLDNLKAIAEHPVYRSKVNIVTFFGHILSGDLVIKEDYETEVRGMTSSGPQRERWGFDEDGKRSLSGEAIDEGYNNYIQALNEQSEAFQQAKSQVPELIAAFGNLRHVQSYSVHPYLQDGIFQGEPTIIHQMACRTLAPLVGRLWTPIPHPVEDLIFICEVAAQVKRPLDTLTLGTNMYPFNWRALETTGVELEYLSNAMHNSTFLVLTFSATEGDWPHTLEDVEFPACGLIDHCPILDALSITASIGPIYLDLANFLGVVDWPLLYQLSIWGFASTETKLVSVFRSLRKTLRRLSIQGILLYDGSWYNVFLELRKHSIAREDLDIHALWCSTTSDIFRDADVDLVKDFVCEGKNWSQDLPKWLSIDG